jgi:purine-binding chemotaxis protein CheW
MNALARFDAPVADQAAVAQSAEYLSFVLGGELFGISILCIKEIIEATSPTPVPMMPDCLVGVINLRGDAVPVMDLSLRFGRGATSLAKRSCIIIVELADTGLPGATRLIGVMADAVNAVLDIASADIAPPPAYGGRTDFLEGMGKLGGKFEGRFVLLLNVQHVFSPDELGAALQAASRLSTTGERA